MRFEKKNYYGLGGSRYGVEIWSTTGKRVYYFRNSFAMWAFINKAKKKRNFSRYKVYVNGNEPGYVGTKRMLLNL